METLIAAAAVVLVAAVAIPVGLHMASVYTHDGLSVCAANVQPGSSCNVELPSFFLRFNGLDILFTWSTLLPPIAALLLAAPFILDLDNGSYRLAWTQSITRRRWIVVKLAMALAAAVLVALLLSILASWLRGPLDHLNGRMSSSTYDAEGIVPIAYSLFVLGFAVALGALWRRAVPALLSTFVVYIVVRSLMDSVLRQRLLAPIKTTWLVGAGGTGGPNLNQALVISQFVSNKKGVQLSTTQTCVVRSSGGILSRTQSVCGVLHQPGVHPYLYMTAIYQPASRFWALQGVESAIVGGVGLLLILAAGWWTSRRF